MKFKNLFYLLFTTALLVGFASCSSDDDNDVSADLKLEKNIVEVMEGSATTVTITDGNGEYKVSSDNEDVVIANVEAKIIAITGVISGKSTIEVTDKAGKKATITVTVGKSDILGTWAVGRSESDVVTSNLVVTNEIKAIFGQAGPDSLKFYNNGTFDMYFYDHTATPDYTYENNILTLIYEEEREDIDIFKVRFSGNTLKFINDRTAFYQTKYPNAAVSKAICYIYLTRK